MPLIDIQEKENIRKLKEGLDSLPGMLAYRVQGKALQASARVVQRNARFIVPVSSGALRDSIRTGISSSRIPGVKKKVPGSAAVLIAGGKGARHVNLIEYGFTTRSGRRIDAASRPGFGFLSKSVESTVSQQLQAFGVEATKGFIRAGKQIRSGNVPANIRKFIS